MEPNYPYFSMNIMGNKYSKDYLFIEKYLSNEIELWVEPFSGSFGLYKLFKHKIKDCVYNDKDYDTYIKHGFYTNSYNEDYKFIIDKYNNDKSFFYFDPPYLDKEFYYTCKFSIEDHLELYDCIKNLKTNFILSYNDKPLIRELYKDYTIEKVISKSMYRQNEIIITNV